AGQLIISSNIVEGTTALQSRSINKTGAGLAVLSGTNTFTSALSVSGGTLTLSAPNSFTGGLTIADGAAANLNTATSMNTLLPNKITFTGAAGTVSLGSGLTIGGLSATTGFSQVVQASSNA